MGRIGLGVLSAGIGALVGALVTYLLLASLQGISIPEKNALLESLIRLREGTTQGINYAAYSQQLIDIGTKYNLASSRLSDAENEKIKKALDDQATVKTLWDLTLNTTYRVICPLNCEKKLRPILERLGIINGKAEYDMYFAKYKGSSFDLNFEAGDGGLTSAGLSKAYPSLAKAIEALSD